MRRRERAGFAIAALMLCSFAIPTAVLHAVSAPASSETPPIPLASAPADGTAFAEEGWFVEPILQPRCGNEGLDDGLRERGHPEREGRAGRTLRR